MQCIVLNLEKRISAGTEVNGTLNVCSDRELPIISWM